MYKLTIVWETSEITEHYFKTEEQAEQAERNYYFSFGAQVATSYIKRICFVERGCKYGF